MSIPMNARKFLKSDRLMSYRTHIGRHDLLKRSLKGDLLDLAFRQTSIDFNHKPQLLSDTVSDTSISRLQRQTLIDTSSHSLAKNKENDAFRHSRTCEERDRTDGINLSK
eukprot:TRINITY_DN10038_c0_g1_i1.p1 TRINITY_DN10038_c0_g1~~TRINITY_DN10038_c0_g1_i1.p1  ORF type:complete len:110 (-),score=0.18 TRINITY_DN10038_c0_g1_i1:153-482(-)